jgi:hypothetical protein
MSTFLSIAAAADSSALGKIFLFHASQMHHPSRELLPKRENMRDTVCWKGGFTPIKRYPCDSYTIFDSLYNDSIDPEILRFFDKFIPDTIITIIESKEMHSTRILPQG